MEKVPTCEARSDSPGDAELDPSQFHEPAYRRTLRRLAISHVDREGPITFDRLAHLIARAHGFQRTGKRIKRTLLGAIHGSRGQTRSRNGELVFWPDGNPPATVLPFRGLAIGSEIRDWNEVPQPEKLGLLQQILEARPRDTARAVADVLGVGRLTSQLRDEVEMLLGVLHALKP